VPGLWLKGCSFIRIHLFKHGFCDGPQRASKHDERDAKKKVWGLIYKAEWNHFKPVTFWDTVPHSDEALKKRPKFVVTSPVHGDFMETSGCFNSTELSPILIHEMPVDRFVTA
jgi:hypothetical protein